MRCFISNLGLIWNTITMLYFLQLDNWFYSINKSNASSTNARLSGVIILLKILSYQRSITHSSQSCTPCLASALFMMSKYSKFHINTFNNVWVIIFDKWAILKFLHNNELAITIARLIFEIDELKIFKIIYRKIKHSETIYYNI